MSMTDLERAGEASGGRPVSEDHSRRDLEQQRQLVAWQVERLQITKALGRAPGETMPAGKPASLAGCLWSLFRQAVCAIVTLRFADLKRLLIAGWRHEAWVARLRQSELFDRDFYRLQFDGPVGDAVRHYVETGANAGAWPHPLFDTGYYLAKHPDVRAAGLPPLLHYLLTWSQEGRRPNAFFDPRWYARNNPDLETLRLDPLSHYMRFGIDRDAFPSAEFDPKFYRHELRRTGQAADNPLAHFLRFGRQSGLLPALRNEPLGVPVELAALDMIKSHPLGPEVALFVTHSPDGRLKPHVKPYLEALVREGLDVVLIVAADRALVLDESWVLETPKAVVVRENVGFDFAAWAHLMRRYRELFAARLVIWLNDSLIGPVDLKAFSIVMQRVRNSTADLIGLTDNFEHGHHIQSFFLALKPGTLLSKEFHHFVENVVSLPTKNDVIDHYEVEFSTRMQNSGLSTEVLFPARDHLNPSIFHWRALLQAGFPFVKVMLIRDEIEDTDKTGWREMLTERGYDAELVDRLLATNATSMTPVITAHGHGGLSATGTFLSNRL